MKRRVLALGLDAADPTLMEPWMDQGLLPNLRYLRQRGAYGRLQTQINHQGRTEKFSNTEPLWVMALTGCMPSKTGFWDTIEYDPNRYSIELDPVYGGYDYGKYKPFYALGDRCNVTTFDLPVSRVIPGLPGTQITGWGGHHPFYPSESQPAEALANILTQHGPNPIYRKDNGKWWNPKYGKWVRQAVADSCATRSIIGRKLVQQPDWDLCMMGFGETHTAGHDLYHHSQFDHPLHHLHRPKSRPSTAPPSDQPPQLDNHRDPLIKAYQAVDQAVGDILSAAPADSYLVTYSLHGIGANHTDLLSLFFLGEILYRWNFPGKVGFTSGDVSQPPGELIRKPRRGGWSDEIWCQVADDHGLRRWWRQRSPRRFWASQHNNLTSPMGLQRQGEAQHWMPILAYQHLWPQMRAFALPGFADGQIRINLQGREAQGIVPPVDYDATCSEIINQLYRWRDRRSGTPLVKAVQRTRPHGHYSHVTQDGNLTDSDPRLPQADLIVIWHERPTDVIESPDLGRCGPVTYNRTGGHRARGHFMVQGPGIQPGSDLPIGQAVDVAATLLHLLGEPCPSHFDGTSLIQLDSIPSQSSQLSLSQT